jgi:predicted amidophosphoribosyltransferase
MDDIDFSWLGWLIFGLVFVVVMVVMFSALRRGRGESQNYDFPRQCPACGKACPSAARFCSQCGRELQVHND